MAQTLYYNGTILTMEDRCPQVEAVLTEDGRILETGTPEQVTDAVKRLLDVCAPDGGYIFDVNTTIDYGVKHENVLAMFDAVKTYGKY